MTPDEKRIKFWEMQGWKRIEKPVFENGMEEMRKIGLLSAFREYWEDSQIPRIDHSAVIAAWKTLSDLEAHSAVVWLHVLASEDEECPQSLSRLQVKKLLTAPADQMLDAFLYAKGALKPDSQPESKT